MSLSLQSTTLITTFYQVAAGKEHDIFSSFCEKSPNIITYKALGKFDLATFIELDNPYDYHPPITSKGISAEYKITACMWDGSYKSPSIHSLLDKNSVASFVFISLDKSHYTKNFSTDILESFFKSFLGMHPEYKDNLGFYGGVGQSEILAILTGNDFSIFFDFASKIRVLKIDNILTSHDEEKEISLFSLSKNIPLISYNNVISNNNFVNVKGNITPQVLIDCPPGFESNIVGKFGDKTAIFKSVLGEYDLSISYSQPIKASSFLSNLLNFRAKWHKYDPAILNTETYLFEESIPLCKVNSYSIIPAEEYPPIDENFCKEHPHLANKISNFIEKLYSDLSLRNLNITVYDMNDFPMRILGEIANYLEGKEREKSGYLITIEQLLESAEHGLEQRTSSEFLPISSIQRTPQSSTSGILLSIIAINYLVSYIFDRWDECNVRNKENDSIWSGFVFFSDIFGFQLRHGMVFSLPLKSVASPIGSSVTWLGLTHEISHEIWSLLDIEINQAKYISEPLNKILDEKNREIQKEDTLINLRGQYWELFATWYDYFTFFNEEHEHFQTYIWKAWGELPVIKDRPAQYLFRSFVIFLSSKYFKKYQESIQCGEEDEFIKSAWNKYSKYFEKKLGFVNSYIDINDSHTKVTVLELVDKLVPIFMKLIKNYEHVKFQKMINKTYPRIDEHVRKIENNEIINEQIINPFLLLKECRRKICRGSNNIPTFYQNTALLYSFANQVIFLTSNEN